MKRRHVAVGDRREHASKWINAFFEQL